MSSDPSSESNKRPIVEASLMEHEKQAGEDLLDNSSESLLGNSAIADTLDNKNVTGNVLETIKSH